MIGSLSTLVPSALWTTMASSALNFALHLKLIGLMPLIIPHTSDGLGATRMIIFIKKGCWK
jgi:hypothetical protein